MAAAEWTWDLGYAAIFGGIGHERDDALATEQEIFEHVLQQQLSGDDSDDAETVKVAEGEEKNVGVLHIVNYYTGEVVAESDLWLRDECYRHMHYEQPGLTGKFLAFEGVRYPEKTPFKLHIELDETVEDTLRVVGASAYKGDVPGPALESVVGHLNTEDLSASIMVKGAGSMTWREILASKPAAWTANINININIEMSMHNPHAVVVRSAAEEE